MRDPLEACGLLIDMDGVLLDTERLAEGCWKKAEEATGFFMPEGYYFSLIGLSLPLIEERLSGVMTPDCDIGDFLAVANRIYRKALEEEQIPVKAGAQALLEHLHARSIPACLVTSTFRELADHKLGAAGLGHLLPNRVCGDEISRSKPEPDGYLAGARKLGFQPTRLLALEDSANGLMAALAAGCQVAHVPDLAPVPTSLQLRADRIYGSLGALLAALQRRELIIGES
ncbi:MAG TPA: HAD family phosphatase [Oceanipulchritudo sp.]|nr:HAD family phosphatase [Oceanipulchritudo sp.]